MVGLWFLLIALLLGVFSSIIKKTVLHEKSSHDAAAYAILSFILGGLYAVLFYLISGPQMRDLAILFNPTVLLLLLADIFVWGFGSVFFYPAYKHVPVSEQAIISPLNGFFALFLGLVIFKTETFNVLHVIGGICILASVMLLFLGKEKLIIGKYSLLLVLASFIFGLGAVFDNIIIAHQYFSSVAFLQIFNFGLAAFVVLLFSPKSFRKITPIYHDKKALSVLLFNSVSTFLTFFFVYQAYKLHIVASQANMISSSQVVLVVFLGALFFNENTNLPQKVLAAIVTGIGIYLVS